MDGFLSEAVYKNFNCFVITICSTRGRKNIKYVGQYIDIFNIYLLTNNETTRYFIEDTN